MTGLDRRDGDTENESRTIKKAEHRRIDAFELWHWRRLLRVPWRAAPGKSGLHARGEGERVLALESREGTRVTPAQAVSTEPGSL